jgi:hypothetical protein
VKAAGERCRCRAASAADAAGRGATPDVLLVANRCKALWAWH